MLVEIYHNIKKRLNFSGSIFTIIGGGFLLLIYPLVSYINAKFYIEHGYMENLQILMLILALFLLLTAKVDKNFFITIALVVVFMIMREINLGKHYFCDRFLDLGTECKWSNLKFGYLANVFRGWYLFYIVYYIWKNKVYSIFIKYLKYKHIFIWDFMLILVGIVLATISETSFINNEPLEECGEMLFYMAFIGCIWRYRKNPYLHTAN